MSLLQSRWLQSHQSLHLQTRFHQNLRLKTRSPQPATPRA